MVDTKQHKECSGCTACSVICKHGAISMAPDRLGFMYPKVNPTKCMLCGLCVAKCPFGHTPVGLSATPQYYVARHVDDAEVRKSQSGGVFIAIANYVIQSGGVVYGAGYGEHFKVVHKRVRTFDQLQELRGSKYVQSDIDGIFTKVKNDLANGANVLFVGTPCQVAGLRACTTVKEQKNLLMVDIICHGVPSPQVWQDYLLHLEKKHRDKLVKVIFRDKEEFGWIASKSSFVFSRHPNKKVHVLGAFNREVLFRESCGNCSFCSINRLGDLTIGDFWGDKSIVDWNDTDRGLSTLMINSDKGFSVFNKIKDSLEIKELNVNDILQYNLQYSTPEHPLRCKFEKEYADHGFYTAMRKYHDFGWKKRIRMCLGWLMRKLLK